MLSLKGQRDDHQLMVGDVVEVINHDAASDILLVCEHASNYIPPYFDNLGLSEIAATSHAAWDPGALSVAKSISSLLGATLIAPTFSRLIYDCNRPPESPAAIPEKSEVYEIPGNSNLSHDDKQSRVDQLYLPYRQVLSDFVDVRIAAGRAPIVITIHSFTPIFHGHTRQVEIGIIHDQDARLADNLLAICKKQSDLIFKLNDPYGPEDEVTHTLIEQGQSKGLLNAMIEIRNDLIVSQETQSQMAGLLASCLSETIKNIK